MVSKPIDIRGISCGFPQLFPSWGQVTNVLLTRSPLSPDRSQVLVRLACVRHAASVHPEPGSNSPYCWSLFHQVNPGFGFLIDPLVCWISVTVELLRCCPKGAKKPTSLMPVEKDNLNWIISGSYVVSLSPFCCLEFPGPSPGEFKLLRIEHGKCTTSCVPCQVLFLDFLDEFLTTWPLNERQIIYHHCCPLPSSPVVNVHLRRNITGKRTDR
jgi:hypothetical protein